MRPEQNEAPALLNNRRLRSRNEDQIRNLIRNGTQTGMPPFALPDNQLRSLAKWVHAMNALAWEVKPEGDAVAGAEFFFGNGQCATCYMVSGRGTPNGPDLSDLGRHLTVHDLEESLDNPASRAGKRSSASCPGWAWCPQDPWAVVRVKLRDGSVLRGFARGEGKHDLQLQTFDGKFHLLLEGEYQAITREKTPLMPAYAGLPGGAESLLAYLARLGGVYAGPAITLLTLSRSGDRAALPKPRPGEWPNYNGVPGSESTQHRLDQINTKNASRLQLQWLFVYISRTSR